MKVVYGRERERHVTARVELGWIGGRKKECPVEDRYSSEEEQMNGESMEKPTTYQVPR
jgi:hypothetical protein